MKYFLFLIVILISTNSSRSQNAICAFDDFYAQMMGSGGSSDYEDNSIQWILDNPNFTGTYYIPTVVHILHDNGPENISDTQVQDAIDQANEQLSGINNGINNGHNTNIQLYLATIDPYGNCTNGINRVQVNDPVFPRELDTWLSNYTWPVDKYFNVAVIKEFSSSSLVGISSHPTTVEMDADTDGNAIRHYNFGNSGTALGNTENALVHEFGHYLGLYHLNWKQFGLPNDNCLPCTGTNLPDNANDEVGSCLHLGDRICDTDPVNWPSIPFGNCDIDNSGCETCDSSYDFNFPKDNYMSYDAPCHVTYTQGQSLRMYYTLEEFRPNLWSTFLPSSSCDGPSLDVTYSSNVFDYPSGVHLINGNIRVNNGATLNIPQDATLRFCNGKKLIIEQGATVNLNGTLTNACDGYWEGIEIKGAGSRLIANDPATIQNSNIGVDVNSGGKIEAVSTSFLNNTVSLQIGAIAEVCELTDCQFLLNSDYAGSNFFTMMYVTTNLNKCEIRGGYFKNDFNGLSRAILSDNGNFSIAASYTYNKFGLPDGTNKVRFINFERGIDAFDGLELTYTVENAMFENCDIGCFNNEVNSCSIKYCEFDIGSNQVGVAYQGTTIGIINQENRYIGSGNAAIGVICNEIGTMTNTIRKNTFSNLEYGNLANGENGVSDINGVRGLNYKCNFNLNVDYDHAVADSPSNIDNVRPVQGLFDIGLTRSAANRLSYNSTIIGSDFYNEGGEPVNYHFDLDGINEEPINNFNVTTLVSDENTCTREEMLDYPPIIIHIPHLPFGGSTDSIKALIHQALCNNQTPSIPSDYPYEQELWDETITFILNEIMHGNQLHFNNYNSNYLVQGVNLTNKQNALISWLEGLSFEADLTVVKIYAYEGHFQAAQQLLANLINKWCLSSNQNQTLQDYQSIVNTVSPNDLTSLTTAQQNALTSLLNNSSTTETSKSWIKSILRYYDNDYPFEFTTLSGTRIRSSEKSSTQLELYPNPFTDIINIQGNDGEALELYDIQGRLVVYKELNNGLNQITMNSLQSGTYIYKLVSKQNIKSGKLVKL